MNADLPPRAHFQQRHAACLSLTFRQLAVCVPANVAWWAHLMHPSTLPRRRTSLWCTLAASLMCWTVQVGLHSESPFLVWLCCRVMSLWWMQSWAAWCSRGRLHRWSRSGMPCCAMVLTGSTR